MCVRVCVYVLVYVCECVNIMYCMYVLYVCESVCVYVCEDWAFFFDLVVCDEYIYVCVCVCVCVKVGGYQNLLLSVRTSSHATLWGQCVCVCVCSSSSSSSLVFLILLFIIMM